MQVVCIEHLALLLASSLVGLVLENRIVGADLWVEGSWNESGTHVLSWGIDGSAAAVLGFAPWVGWGFGWTCGSGGLCGS